MIKTNSAVRRQYSVVRRDGEWLVDDFSEKVRAQRARVGETLRYQESFELDGQPIDARLATTVVRFEPAPGPPYVRAKAGHRWYRLEARVKSNSSGNLFVSAAAFKAIDAADRRYTERAATNRA